MNEHPARASVLHHSHYVQDDIIDGGPYNMRY